MAPAVAGPSQKLNMTSCCATSAHCGTSASLVQKSCCQQAASHLIVCRVYKNFDPRAKIVREVAEEVFSIQGRDPLIDVAVELEKVARSDEYFIKRNLYPNVDFYSGGRLHPMLSGILRLSSVCMRTRTLTGGSIDLMPV